MQGAARRRYRIEELEPRILYSADLVPAGVDATAADAMPVEQRMLDHGADLEAGLVADLQPLRQELVFVDVRVPDYLALVDDITRDSQDRRIEVVVLDPEQDGIQQIGNILAQRSDLHAVHILSHGEAGVVQLGAGRLDFDSLLANAVRIKAWGEAFNGQGDLLIYGCNVADSEAGRSLLDALARLTGADVAASDDATGARERGGDWDLEVALGPIETGVVGGARVDGLLELPAEAAPVATLASAPLMFEENAGQASAEVDFLARGNGYAVALAGGDAYIGLKAGDASDVLRLHLIGAIAAAPARGEDLLASKTNYLVGDAEQWRTEVANFGAVRYAGVYQGIDLRYYGSDHQLEYDFVVAAGADAAAIRLDFAGASDVSIADNGDLLITLESGNRIAFKAPVSYQDGPGGREAVASRYVLSEDGSVGFAVGPYDTARTLVIDPVLSYATYFGGTGTDVVNGMAVDAAGNVYLTGYTLSTGLLGGLFGLGGGEQVFVTKLAPDLGSVLYTTFIGGSGEDVGTAIAVDVGQNAYVTGYTKSADFAVSSAYQGARNGSQDAFLFKLDATGGALVYSTYLGGSGGSDTGWAVAVDAAGSAYVTGVATSANFPLTAGAADSVYSGDEAFVTKFAPGGSTLAYSTFIGGGSSDVGYGIAVDASGSAVVVGYTGSNDLPVTANALQSAKDGGGDAFVARLDGTGGAFGYLSYLGGGGGNDIAYNVTVDSAGRIYLTGETDSNDFDVTAGAYQTVRNGTDAFVSIIDPTASGAASLVYSTFLGGSKNKEAGLGIGVDGMGRVYVAGQTDSDDFPATGDAHQGSRAGGDDAFLAVLNPAGSGAGDLVYASYFGGSSDDYANIAAYRNGQFYIAGDTQSNSGIALAGGYDTSYNGNPDGFAAIFTFDAPPVVTLTGAPLAYSENAGAVAVDAALTLSDSDSPLLSGASVRISANYAGGQDVLAFNSANPWGILGAWNVATGEMVLSGAASVADYQAALRTVTYENTSEMPSTLVRTLTVTAFDQQATGSNPATRQLNVTAVNDAPVAALPPSQSTPVNTPLLLSVGGGNAVSVSDVDAGAGQLRVSLIGTNGTSTLATTAGLSLVTGNGTSNVVLQGSLASINSALDGLTFTPAANFSGGAQLQVLADDLGNSGTGGAKQANPTLFISVVYTPPNLTVAASVLPYVENAPATAVDPALSLTPGNVTTLTAAQARITAGYAGTEDVLDYSPAALPGGVAASWDAGSGTLSFTGSATAAQYEALLRSVTYRNTSESPGSAVRTVTFSVADGVGGDSAARQIAVTAVNDPPVITSNGGGTAASIVLPENTTAVTTVTAADVDVPAPTLTYSIAGGADAAHFSIHAVTGALAFLAAPDYEAPTDADLDNVYVVVVQVSDGSAVDTQTLSVSVSDSGMVLDQFNAVSYAGNDGSQDWSDNWQELGETNGVSSGSVRVASGALRIGGDEVNIAGRGAVREADLSGATVAHLSFDYRRVDVDGGGGSVSVQVSGNGGGSWTTLATYSLSSFDATFKSAQFDISAHAGASTQVRFVGSGTAEAYIYLDNVRIEHNGSSSNTAPEITSDGGADEVAVAVVEGATAVTTVAASDADVPAQALAFSVSGGADQGAFTIDAVSGALRFAVAPDYEAPGDADLDNVYEVLVQGTDSSGASDTQLLLVSVVDANEAPVSVVLSGGAVAENTDTSAGVSVGTLATTDVDGADLHTYTVVGGADAGKFSVSGDQLVLSDGVLDFEAQSSYQVTVRATDSGGLFVDAAFVVSVTNLQEAASGSVAVSGSVAQGETLAADTSTVSDPDGLGAFSYQWSRSLDGGATWTGIAGATSGTYVLGSADVGTLIRVSVAYVDGQGGAENLASAAVGPVANVNDTPTGTVTIAGTAAEDQTLAADASAIGDADGLGAFSYQWARSGDGGATWLDIAGATAGTYVLGDADVGTVVRVSVAYVDGQGTAESLTSAAAGPVANVNDVPGGADATVATLEDTGYVFQPTDFVFADADSSDTLQAVRIASLPSQGGLTLYGAAVNAGDLINGADLAAGGLAYLPATDAAGAYAFAFRVNDGIVDSATAYTMTIEVTAVNDAPALVVGSDQTVDEDAGPQTVAGFASAAPGGGPDEAGQVLTYAVSNDNNALFAVQPALDASGKLTYTPAADANGVANVCVYVTDNGGNANGGADTSVARMFSITVDAVNDVPVLAVNAGASVAWSGSFTLGAALLLATDVDHSAAQITYALTALPATGVLSLLGVPLALGASFTQADVDAGRLSFSHNGAGAGPDTLALSVADGSGGSLGTVTFNVSVAAPPSPPVVVPVGPGPSLPPPVVPPATDPGPLTDPASSTDPGDEPGEDSEESEHNAAVQAAALMDEAGATPSGGSNELSSERASARLALLQLAAGGDAAGASGRGGGAISVAALVPAVEQSVSFASGLETAAARVAVMQVPALSLGNADWIEALDELHRQVEGKTEVEGMLAVSSVAVTGSLSVGYVIWLLRGGLLLSSLLSSLPAWHAVDPLPVLARGGDQDDEQGAGEDPLERLFSKARDVLRAAAPAAAPAASTPPPAPGAAGAQAA